MHVVHGRIVFMLQVQKFSNDIFALFFPTMTWSLVRVRVCISADLKKHFSTVHMHCFVILLLFYICFLSYFFIFGTRDCR